MTQIPRRMTPVPALSPVPGCLTAPRLRLLVLPHALEGESSPWPRLVNATSTNRQITTEGPAWDAVDEWGVQSFPASDAPPNRP
jgi:hypothetical protein